MSPVVPAGMLASLEAAPHGARLALLVRHADRAAFPPGEDGSDVGLTPAGEARAAAFSKQRAFESRPVAWCHSSPLPRCTATAMHMGLRATPDSLLGDPGVFVTDCTRAGEAFLGLGAEPIVRAQIAGHPWPFMRPLAEGAGMLLAHVARGVAAHHGVGVLVSHDTIVMPTIAWATGERFEDGWLDPLDGIVVVDRGAGAVGVIWRGRTFDVRRHCS